MKTYLFSAVSVLSLLAAGGATAHDGADNNDRAHAEDHGWYLRGNTGYGVHTDTDITGGIDSSYHGNGLQSEGNTAYSLGAGYDFGEHWRLELDADSLETSLGSISQTPSSKGSLATESVMLNAIYDFDGFGRIEPYIGAGAGLVSGKGRFASHDFASVDNVLVTNPTCVGDRTAFDSSSCAISDSDTGFGWQLLAGLGYQISEKLTWDTHYTYLNGPDLDLDGHIVNSATGAFANTSSKLSDVGAHTVMTGLRYRFGEQHSTPVAIAPKPVVQPRVVDVVPDYICWDGSSVSTASLCAPEPVPVVTKTCWDGSIIDTTSTCPTQVVQAPVTTYNCWDGSVVYDLATCPVEPVTQIATTNLNACGSSPVAIFDVPVNKSPKQMSRLGTMPEFGDSHGLTPDQFYQKLDARYNATSNDKAYLNYLFKSMGYSNGWADAQPYMFSETVLPIGTTGLLGLGEQHHYSYSILPTNDHDRQAFRIQSANGSVIHFMKTCGNYMYACE